MAETPLPRTVARKELRGLRGSRTVTVGTGLVGLVYVLAGYVVPTTTRTPTMVEYDALLRGVTLVVLPLYGLLLGYRAVVAERATGQLTLTLSLPHSRTDVVLGKALARGLVLVCTLGTGVLLGGALVEYPFGSVAPGRLAGYLGITLLYGLAFLDVGLALSTLTASLRRATALTFGVFFLLVVAWPSLEGSVLDALQLVGLADERLPDWARFVYGAEPSAAYTRALEAFVATDGGSVAGGADPWYLGGGAAVGVLVGWVVVPVVVGILRFRRRDL